MENDKVLQEFTLLERRFIQIYGLPLFNKIYQYIIDNDILDFYLKARRGSHEDLFYFGFHYGIVEIVAFCYCVLKLPIDINDVIRGYYKSIDSTTEISKNMNAVPVESSGGNRGIVIGSSDKFTPYRKECIRFMMRMQKFSTYKVVNGKFIYSIVDKYIKDYRLLEVY